MLVISPKKLFSFWRYLSFCLDFLIMYQNGLKRYGKKRIKKIRLISKFMTSQPGKQTITTHILPNISRRRGNGTKKFGQLIERNMRNIFLKNHTQNVVEKLAPDP